LFDVVVPEPALPARWRGLLLCGLLLRASVAGSRGFDDRRGQSGFDDSGRQFDGNGNLRDWWTADDGVKFKQRAAELARQYSGYTVLDNRHINGELTLGENIGDLSGMAVALKAYQISLNGKPAPEIDGFTGQQRFFLGWAQVWRRKYRDAELLKRLVVDPHSPSEFRANGPASNIDAFYDAFAVKPDDRMYRAPNERVKIW